jgi:hypothetical protein
MKGQKTGKLSAILAIPFLLITAPTMAGDISAETATAEIVTVETEIYEWVENAPETSADNGEWAVEQAHAPSGSLPGPARKALASFGPFHVVGHDRVELAGIIDSGTDAQFRALLKAYPGIKQIDMIDCPGTEDDAANFAIARMVRRAGIATYVPDGGFVGSGGVELFLAGASRSAAPTAEFAVHSWRDSDGLEANDYAADNPLHREYLSFYREMGMEDAKARAFYAMTNSVPHDDALYLTPGDIARYASIN